MQIGRNMALQKVGHLAMVQISERNPYKINREINLEGKGLRDNIKYHVIELLFGSK